MRLANQMLKMAKWLKDLLFSVYGPMFSMCSQQPQSFMTACVCVK